MPVPPTKARIANPAQVGHAVNSPTEAPIPPNQPTPIFFALVEREKVAKLAFRPTSHEIEKRRSKLTGTRKTPKCWVTYATTSGVSPTDPQQVAIASEGIST